MAKLWIRGCRGRGWYAALAIAAGGQIGYAQGSSLHVLRHLPQDTITSGSSIAVIFDRPVLGALDRTVDPKEIFQIAPAVAGSVVWRDPATLRFLPEVPLPPGAHYVVTVRNTFTAIDGSRLTTPYRFSLSVAGPALLATRPIPDFLPPSATFEALYSAPVDLAVLSAQAYIKFDACPAVRKIDLIVTQAHRQKHDTNRLSVIDNQAWWQRDTAADRFWQLVRLTPAEPLPESCNGTLTLPRTVGAGARHGFPGQATTVTLALPMRRPLAVDEVSCGYREKVCPYGPVVVKFSVPVAGAEVLHHLHLTVGPSSATPLRFTLDGDSSATGTEWTLKAPFRPRTSYSVRSDTALRDVFGRQFLGRTSATRVYTVATGPVPAAITPLRSQIIITRDGTPLLPVLHVNIDTIWIRMAAIPPHVSPNLLLNGGYGSEFRTLTRILATGVTRRLVVQNIPDSTLATNVPLPLDLRKTASGLGVVMIGRSAPNVFAAGDDRPIPTVVQVTDLAAHVLTSATDYDIWVTGIRDGRARAGAHVTLYDYKDRPQGEGITNALGVVHLARPPILPHPEDYYLAITQGNDRLLTSVDLVPDSSFHATVFTERGIYRPGETVHAQAVLRIGMQGDLKPFTRTDSLRWTVTKGTRSNWLHPVMQENIPANTSASELSTFGTATYHWSLPKGAALGEYDLLLQYKAASGILEYDGGDDISGR